MGLGEREGVFWGGGEFVDEGFVALEVFGLRWELDVVCFAFFSYYVQDSLYLHLVSCGKWAVSLLCFRCIAQEDRLSLSAFRFCGL